MKFKNILIILSILIFIFISVGAVSAGDVNIDINDVNDGATVDLVVSDSDNYLSSGVEEELTNISESSQTEVSKVSGSSQTEVSKVSESSKTDVVVVLAVSDTEYGTEPRFTAIVLDNVTGSKVNGDVGFIVYDDEGSIVDESQWNRLNVGKYSVIAYFNGNDEYNAGVSENKTFNVNRLAINVFDIRVDDVSYVDDVILIVRNAVGVNGEKLSGVVTFVINGSEPRSFNITNGTGSYNIGKLPMGVYYINASLFVDNYNNISDFVIFNVITKDPVVIVNARDVDYGNDPSKYFSAQVIDKDGNNITSPAVIFKVKDENGTFVEPSSTLSVGEYTLIAIFPGNANYTAINTTKKFKVNNLVIPLDNVTLGVVNPEINYGDYFVVSVSNVRGVNGELLNGTLKAAISKKTSNAIKIYYGNVTNGVGTCVIDNMLSPGDYDIVSAIFVPNYDSVVFNLPVIVNKPIPTMSVNVNDVVYGVAPSFIVSLNDSHGAIDNSSVELIVLDKSGSKVTSPLDKLSVGEYTLMAIYPENDNYSSVNASKSFTVSKLNASLTITKAGSYYKATTLTVKLVNSLTGVGVANEKINLKIGTKTVTVTTGANGVVTYVIPYAPATYVVTGSVPNSNIDVNGSKLSVKISKAVATITASSLTTTYASGKYFQIKVVAKDKKPVVGLKLTLKVYTGSSYKTVTVTTDSNGVAKYDGSTLSIAKHKVVVSCAESTKYITATAKTAYITVKKGTTTVTAPVVTNTYKENAYFKVTVKNSASGKVISGLTLKINVYTGSKYTTYTVKTNSQGVAQLNTKALAKGTHKVVISSGDAKYTVSKSGNLIKIV